MRRRAAARQPLPRALPWALPTSVSAARSPPPTALKPHGRHAPAAALAHLFAARFATNGRGQKGCYCQQPPLGRLRAAARVGRCQSPFFCLARSRRRLTKSVPRRRRGATSGQQARCPSGLAAAWPRTRPTPGPASTALAGMWARIRALPWAFRWSPFGAQRSAPPTIPGRTRILRKRVDIGSGAGRMGVGRDPRSASVGGGPVCVVSRRARRQSPLGAASAPTAGSVVPTYTALVSRLASL
jgi:hypothetical protein